MTEPVLNLGPRLRDVRLRTGLSLREVARQLGVSPSFVSQLENGKSQPSVATLFALTQLLGVSVDELFAMDEPAPGGDSGAVPALETRPTDERRPTGEAASGTPSAVSRSDFGSPVDVFPLPAAVERLSVTRPGARARLEMDTGVVWERLVTNTGKWLEFREIHYPPHSSSTNDGRLLQHTGAEFGYLVEGELEITVAFRTVTLHAGDAIGFDSTLPHLLRNVTDVPARGIWFDWRPLPVS